MDWRERLAIVSDEAGKSFAESVAVCLPLGISAYELRQLPGGRVPYVDEAAIVEVVQLVAEHDLKLVGLSPGFGKRRLADPTTEQELAEGFPAAFELMARLSIDAITIFTHSRGGRAMRTPPQEAIDALGRAADLCRAAGVELRLENSDASWGNTGANLATMANAVGARVTWDPANSEASGQPAFPDGYRCVADIIAHVHCKNWLPSEGNVDIMSGQADIAGQVAALKADGYPGYYTVEPHQWHDRANATRRNTAQLLELLQT